MNIMESEAVSDDAYGCKCDSETIIFCFDKRTGDYKWSCSGQCFERLPSRTIATQTENTAQSSPTLQQKISTLTQYKTNGRETEYNDVDRNKEIDSQMAKSHAESRNTTVKMPDQVICSVSLHVQKSKTSEVVLVANETCNQVQNFEIAERQGQSIFDDFSNNKDETPDNSNDVYSNSDVCDSTGEHTIGGDDATTDDDDEDQNNATQFDSDDDKDVDNVVNEGDESDVYRSHHSDDISNSPTKVRKPIKGKRKTKNRIPREVFPCDYCTRKCTTKSLYEKHIEWHTRSKETKCDICGKEFSKPGYLINHQKKHKQARRHGEEASEGTDDSLYKEKKLGECRYCRKLIKGKRLENHEKTHTQPRPKPVMECSYCGKTFKSSSSDFARHVRTHTKERPYKCNQCESAFYCQMDLTIHIRRHLGDKRYKCDHCGKAFVRKCNLDEHLRTHTGARPYKCDYCSKSFGFKNVLKVHLVQHTGIRPHVCEYCDKGFAKKAFLDKHLLSHE